jgi:hypothetical protein
VSDVVICDSTVGALGVADGLVFTHWVRVAGDDVPGVDEAGDVAEAAEGDIDEGVCGAEADFDPYCDRWEEDGDKSKEDIAAAHRGGIVEMKDESKGVACEW